VEWGRWRWCTLGFVSLEARYAGERVSPLPDTADATLRVRVVAGMMLFGTSVGVPMPELLAISGIQPMQLSDPDATVPTDRAAAVLERIAHQIPDRVLSLELLAMTPPSAFGLLDLALQHVDTFQEQVDLVLRYARLTSSHAHGWLKRGPELSAYRFRHLASLELLQHPVEMALLHFHRVLERLELQPGDLVEVHFGHDAHQRRAAFEVFFDCPVFFGSFGHAMVFRTPLLERPVRHADPVLARSVVARLEQELHEGEDGLSVLRQTVARHVRPAQYSAAAIAQRMGRSLRSLQRDASEHGITLRQLIDDLRVARARELLRDDSLSVDEVGFLVDYSERSAFSRAFKRATGETPVDYRRRVAN